MKLVKSLVEIGKITIGDETIRFDEVGSQVIVSDEVAEYLGSSIEVLDEILQKDTKKSSKKK